MTIPNNDVLENKFKLNNLLVLIMAAASGITVANLYYIQPLLGEIARTFHVTQISVGFTSMEPSPLTTRSLSSIFLSSKIMQ